MAGFEFDSIKNEFDADRRAAVTQTTRLTRTGRSILAVAVSGLLLAGVWFGWPGGDTVGMRMLLFAGGEGSTSTAIAVLSPLEPQQEPSVGATAVITAQQPFTLHLPLLFKPMVLFLPQIEVNSDLVPDMPPNGAQAQSPNTFLAWRWLNQDAGQARYTLFLEQDDPTPDAIVAQNLVRTLFSPGPLVLNATYYWQIETLDAHGQLVRGPVWSFRTEGTVAAPAIGTMVPVPAGEFLMGCDSANTGGYKCETREFPLHRVWLDAYEIDKYEVTNGEYRACVAAGACRRPLKNDSNLRDVYYPNPAFRDYPVLYVSWWNAQDYCRWAGKRLPTEAEWEKAARGPVDTRVFPWGNYFTADCTHANRAAEAEYVGICNDDTTRVGSFPLGSSPYGAMDMSGNVFEWVTDYFNQTYYRRSPYYNPVNTTLFPELLFVIRGGSYRDNVQYLRTSHRHFGHWGPTRPNEDVPYYRSSRLGFRCARPLPN